MRGLRAYSRLSRVACGMLATFVACMLCFAVSANFAYAEEEAGVSDVPHYSDYKIDKKTFVYKVDANGEPVVQRPTLTVRVDKRPLVVGVEVEETSFIGDCFSVGSHTAHTWSIPRLWGVGYAYSIIPKRPIMKSLKRSGKYLVARWSFSSTMGVDQYEKLYVQVSTSSKFTKSKTLKKTIAGTKTKFTMSGVKRGKTYYFRVRGLAQGYDGNSYYSNWSKVYKYKRR